MSRSFLFVYISANSRASDSGKSSAPTDLVSVGPTYMAHKNLMLALRLTCQSGLSNTYVGTYK